MKTSLQEARLSALVLDSVTSDHSRRSYRTGLVAFFAWIRTASAGPRLLAPLSSNTVRRRFAAGMSPLTLNLRLSPICKLALEMSDNGMLDPATATAIERLTWVERRGARTGNWLVKDQANALLNAPDPRTLSGLRDWAILGLLLGCGLRWAELLRLNLKAVWRLVMRNARATELGKLAPHDLHRNVPSSARRPAEN